MEGDGVLSLDTYSPLQEIATAVTDKHYPNVEALVKSLAPNNTLKEKLRQYANSCVQPAISYYLHCFNLLDGELYHIRAFKAARLFSPEFVTRTNPVPDTVDQLSLFPTLTVMSRLVALKAS